MSPCVDFALSPKLVLGEQLRTFYDSSRDNIPSRNTGISQIIYNVGVGPGARQKFGCDDICIMYGVRGILRQKIFEFRVSEMAFPAF